MRQKQSAMSEWLQNYIIPDASELEIKAVIKAGKKYMNGPAYNENSTQSILLNQIQFLPPYLWVIQIALTIFAIVSAIILGQWSAPFYYPLTVLAVVVPVLTLLGTMQISKSTLYDMWEIEQSSRTPLVKIIACRMLIMGIFDLFLITVIMLFVAYFYRQPVIEMVLYGIIPFNISCTCYLLVCTKSKTKELSYQLITCMLCMAAVFIFVLHYKFLFEASMLWGWVGFYVLSIVLFGKTLQQYLKKEKMIGELVWNLQ